MTSLKLLKKNFGFAESDINKKNAWAFLYLWAFKKRCYFWGYVPFSKIIWPLLTGVRNGLDQDP